VGGWALPTLHLQAKANCSQSDGVLNALLITGTTEACFDDGIGCLLADIPLPQLGIMKPIQAGKVIASCTISCFSSAINGGNYTVVLRGTTGSLPSSSTGRTVELELVWQAFESLRSSRDWVLVEALGGLGSPVSEEFTVADLAAEWRLPTVVVPVNLGRSRRLSPMLL